MNNRPPELDVFIDDLPQLLKSVNLLDKASAGLNSKNAGALDWVLFGFAAFNFGTNLIKTINDGQNLYQAVVTSQTPLQSQIVMISEPVPVTCDWFVPSQRTPVLLVNYYDR